MPRGTISYDNFTVTDPSRCITCMRCVFRCPVHARSVDAAIVAQVTDFLRARCSDRKENELLL